jgi:hypothetical protein
VDGVEEVAAAELQEVEVAVCCCAPEPKRVNGMATITDDRPGVPIKAVGTSRKTSSLPSLNLNAQFNSASTASLGCMTSQGSGRRSQWSGCSTCRPPAISWRKMPYSYRRP